MIRVKRVRSNLALCCVLISLSLVGCGSATTTLLEIPAPSPPSDVSVFESDGNIALIWSYVEGASSYEVWYGTTNDFSDAKLWMSGIKETCAKLSGLTNGVTYYMWIKAVNTSGISDRSVVVSGMSN